MSFWSFHWVVSVINGSWHQFARQIRSWRQRKQRLYLGFLISVGFCLIPLLGNVSPAESSSITRATVTEILDGSQIYIQDQPVKVNAVATKGQKVRTGNSRAQLKFNTGATARVAKNSLLLVGSQCVQVQRGTVLVNGGGTSCTNSIVAAARGTTYVLESTEDGEEVSVLEGEVEVESLPGLAEPPIDFKPLRMTEGEWCKIGRDRKWVIRKLDQQEYCSLLTGPLFTNYRNSLPSHDRIKRSFQRLYPGADFPERRRVVAPWYPPRARPGGRVY